MARARTTPVAPLTFPDWTPECSADWNAWLDTDSRLRAVIVGLVISRYTRRATDPVRVTELPRSPERDRQVWELWLSGRTLAEIAHIAGLENDRCAQKAVERIVARLRVILGQRIRAEIRTGQRPNGRGGRTGRTVNDRSADFYSSTIQTALTRARQLVDELGELLGSRRVRTLRVQTVQRVGAELGRLLSEVQSEEGAEA